MCKMMKFVSFISHACIWSFFYLYEIIKNTYITIQGNAIRLSY